MSNGSTPQISQVKYDPGVLTVRWAPMSVPDLSGFRVFLKKQGAPDPEHKDTGPTVDVETFDKDLTDGHYTTWVATLINDVVGEQSDPLPVITVTPDVHAVVYDVTPEIGLTVRWETVVAEGQTGYVAILDEVGTGPLKTVSTSDLFAIFGQSLQFSRTYNVIVRATGHFGIIEGPSSTVYHPVLDTPTVSNLTYDLVPAAAATLRWDKVDQPTVTGYLGVLQNTTEKTSVNEPTAELFSVFAGSLKETDAYKAFVRATGQGGVAQGPKSVELVPIVAQANHPALNYNGTVFPFSWSGVTGSGVTDYEAELYKDDVMVDQKSGPETIVTFTQAFTNGVVYSARVRGIASQVQGPWTDHAPGPYGMAAIITPDSFGRISQVEINQTSTITFTIDDAGNVTDRALVTAASRSSAA